MFRIYDPEEDIYRDGCSLNEDGVVSSSWGKDKYSWIIQLNSGLKDSYGKDIYDGDYLSVYGSCGSGTVVFKNGGFFVEDSFTKNGKLLYYINKHYKTQIVNPSSDFSKFCLVRKNGRLRDERISLNNK